jgi:aspartyl-tRNA(Asn)/glutamyl-tRNA(Gln) amidotransferase subunit B
MRMVERPLERKDRLMRQYGLPATDAGTLKSDVPLADYFEALARDSRHPKPVANWVINNLKAKLAESGTGLADLRFRPEQLLALVDAIESGGVSFRAAQEVFAEMFESGDAPSVIIERRGLSQVSDEAALETLCEEVIAAHPKSAEDFRLGKAAALNFLKGQVMRRSQGRANPGVVGGILARRLAG